MVFLGEQKQSTCLPIHCLVRLQISESFSNMWLGHQAMLMAGHILVSFAPWVAYNDLGEGWCAESLIMKAAW